MNKKVASLVVTASLITTMSTTVFAEPLSDTLRSQQGKMKQSQTSLESVQKQRQKLESSIEDLDSQIEGLLRDISANNNKIAKTQNDIKASEKDLAKAEADLKEEESFFDQRMKAMYVSGNEGYLEILLNSNGITDFFEKLEGVKKVIQLNKTVVNELDNKKKVIVEKKKSLDNENDKLLKLKSDHEKKLASLNQSKAEENKIIVQCKAQEKLYGDQVNQSKSLIAETMKKMQATRNQVQAQSRSITPSRGGVTTIPYSSDSVIAYAYTFIGIDYQWGGTGPRYDCSGFVQAVYAHFGISIGRSTYDQVKAGRAVSIGSLQPGDLIFFHPGSRGPEHVGMYVGNGCYIHAPRSGEKIQVASLGSRSDIVAARRVR